MMMQEGLRRPNARISGNDAGVLRVRFFLPPTIAITEVEEIRRLSCN